MAASRPDAVAVTVKVCPAVVVGFAGFTVRLAGESRAADQGPRKVYPVDVVPAASANPLTCTM